MTVKMELVLLAAALLFVSSPTRALEVTIGESTIVLPDTTARAKRGGEAAIVFANSTLTPAKRPLAVWIDAAQKESAAAFFPDRYRYGVSYTIKSLEKASASATDFGQVKRAMQMDMDTARNAQTFDMPRSLEQLRKRLAADGIDPDTGITAAGPASIELLTDTERQLGYLVLLHVQAASSSGAQASKWLLTCANVQLVLGKVITTNVFGEFIGEDDREWVTETCTELTGAIAAGNVAP